MGGVRLFLKINSKIPNYVQGVTLSLFSCHTFSFSLRLKTYNSKAHQNFQFVVTLTLNIPYRNRIIVLPQTISKNCFFKSVKKKSEYIFQKNCIHSARVVKPRRRTLSLHTVTFFVTPAREPPGSQAEGWPAARVSPPAGAATSSSACVSAVSSFYVFTKTKRLKIKKRNKNNTKSEKKFLDVY